MNTTLTTLNLESNFIGDQCAQALVEALKINTTLATLDLEKNKIKKDIILIIFRKLKINIINKKRLRYLQILCLEKLKKINRISEIKSLNPIIYNSYLMKY
jgi:hypothetical protein